MHPPCSTIFFFNDTATTEIYTLSLHDALPIYVNRVRVQEKVLRPTDEIALGSGRRHLFRIELMRSHPWVAKDRKSTRLNSSHLVISYAVFCLKKKICSTLLLT